MMDSTLKVWIGFGTIGAVSAAASLSGDESIKLIGAAQAAQVVQGQDADPGEAVENDGSDSGRFHGNLDDALAKIMMGEGGEGGAGLTPMWPSVSAPALTGNEIETVVFGNSLKTAEHVAYYFGDNHRLEGWTAEWNKVGSNDCPNHESPDDLYFWSSASESCWKKTVLTLEGTWRIDNHKLCLDAAISGTEHSETQCSYVTILLDDVALFDEAGNVRGKGMRLLAGRNLDQ